MRQLLIESDISNRISSKQLYNGPPYTPAIVAGILRAYGLPPQPDFKSPRDQTDQFLLTAYPPQEITNELFREDLLLDWQMRKGVLENRRVAFLLNAPTEGYMYLIIQYSKPDNKLAQALWKKHGKEIQTEGLRRLLRTDTFAKQVLKFYGKVEVRNRVGLQADELTAISRIKVALSKIIANQVLLEGSSIARWRGKECLAVMLVNKLLIELREYKEDKNAMTLELAKAHRQQCQQAILDCWDQLKDKNELYYKQLQCQLASVWEPSQLADPSSAVHMQKQLSNLPLELLTAMLVAGKEKYLSVLSEYQNPSSKIDHLSPLNDSKSKWSAAPEAQKEPEYDSETGRIEVTKLMMNKQPNINFKELKPKIKNGKDNITELLNKKFPMHSLRSPIQKIKLEDSMKNLHAVLDKFLECYSDMIDLTFPRGKLEQRKFSDKVDEDQEFLFRGILYVRLRTDHAIFEWQKIIEETNQKIQLTLTESKTSALVTKEMLTLFGHNEVMIARLNYYAPIVINLNHLRIHFGCIIMLIENQIRILDCLKAAYVLRINSDHAIFDSLRGLLSNIIRISPEREKEKYLRKRQKYNSELKETDLDQLHQICRLQFKYSTLDAKMDFLSISKDMATATQINFFSSLCITHHYSQHQARLLQDKYFTSLKNHDFSENSESLSEFVKEVDFFVKQVRLMLSGLPQRLCKEDKDFLSQYDKIIWTYLNLNEILVSVQQVVCVLSLLIPELLDAPDRLLLSTSLQQQQIELLKIEKPILLLMRNEDVGFINQWCYLENKEIKTVDVSEKKYGDNTKERVKRKVQQGFQKVGLYEGLLGFKIETILKIHDQLIDSLADNHQIRLYQFPPPTSYEKIVAESNKNYMELMDSEEKSQAQAEAEKKNSPPPAPMPKNKPRRKPALISKEEKNDETKLSVVPLSDARKKFMLIQTQFQNFVADSFATESNRESLDNELKQQLFPLFEECKEPDLKVQIYNLFSDYFIVTSQKLSKKNLLNIELIDRLNVALTYKKTALFEFNNLPETDLSVTHRYFFDDNINSVETLINDVKKAQAAEMDRVCARMEDLTRNRGAIKAKLGELWYKNPKPKNEYLSLQGRKSEMVLLGQKIMVVDCLFYSMTNSFPNSKKTLPLNQGGVRILPRPPSQSFAANLMSRETKGSIEPPLASMQLDDKIAESVKNFQTSMKTIVNAYVNRNGLDQEPENFFPAEILKSVIEFMSIIKRSVNKPCQIFTVGGLVINLLQKKSVAEQEFNNFDADIVTNVDKDELKRIALDNGLDYRITGVFLEFTAFKFRFKGVNFDVISKVNFNLLLDRESRNININGLYLGFNKDFSFSFIDNNQLLFRLLEAQLLTIPRPGLIKACSGHFKGVEITQLIPQWQQLRQWVLTSGPQGFKESDFPDLEQTLKCFIADPTRLLQVAFMLRKEMIQLKDFDMAMQICFTNCEEHFFLPMIIEEHVLSKGSAVHYINIFSKFIKHAIKKAGQSLDCTAKVDENYQAKLMDIFSRMMQWYFVNRYFVRIFTLPIRMKAEQDMQKNIDQACHNLFCPNPSKEPVYNLLLKNLIELNTARINSDLKIKMLPFVLALVITAQGSVAGEADVVQLIGSIVKVVRKIPGLNQLYLGLSTQQIPASVKRYLTLFVDTVDRMKINAALLVLEEKSRAELRGESQAELSAHINLSLLSPPGASIQNAPLALNSGLTSNLV